MIDEHRENLRYETLGDYFYSGASAGAKIACELKNISATGACITSDAPLVIGESIFLHVCREVDFGFKAKIVWKRENSYGVLLDLETEEDFYRIIDVINCL